MKRQEQKPTSRARIILRIQSTSTLGEQIRFHVEDEHTGRRAKLSDVIKFGFFVAGDHAAEVLALVAAQVKIDNAKLAKRARR